MVFHPMDPALLETLLEGYQNELAPEVKALDAFYRQFSCPGCKSRSCQKELARGHVFSDPATLIPRNVLRCSSCRCLFDPHSGLVLEMGNPGRIPPDIPLIVPMKD